MREFLEAWTSVDIGEAGCAHLLEGIESAAVSIAGYHDFEHTRQRTEDALLSGGMRSDGLETVDPWFLERVARAMANAL